MRNFGGIRLTARPVSASKPETGQPFFHPLLPGEPLDQPVRVIAGKQEMRSPFAGKRNQTTPQFLEYAAYYLAGVMCEQNGHLHAPEEWPCKRALDFAYTQLHVLATSILPTPKQEESHAESAKGSRKSAGKSAGKSKSRSR